MTKQDMAAAAEKLFVEGRENGLSKDEIIIGMFSELKIPLTEANKVYGRLAKERGESARITFRSELYKLGRLGPVTDEMMTELQKVHGTENTKRHWKQFVGIQKLINDIWSAKE
jgi:hypothetical protein